MIKRVVVAGCRDFNNYELAKEYIDFCIANIKNKYKLIFVSGGANGADTLGEKYAKEMGYELEIYPAQWQKYGLKAGPLRNRQMAEIADYVICFWDGKSSGTKSMINETKAQNKPIKIKYIK